MDSKSFGLAELVAADLAERFKSAELEPRCNRISVHEAPNKNTLADIEELEIFVWPAERNAQPETRVKDLVEYTIAIAVLDQLGDDTTKRTDQLTTLCESIQAKLRGQTFDGAGVHRTEHGPLYSPADAREGTFAGRVLVRMKRYENAA